MRAPRGRTVTQLLAPWRPACARDLGELVLLPWAVTALLELVLLANLCIINQELNSVHLASSAFSTNPSLGLAEEGRHTPCACGGCKPCTPQVSKGDYFSIAKL